MVPTSQSLDNDCLRACVASILAVPLESLPTPPDEFTDENWAEYHLSLRTAVRLHGFDLLTLKSLEGGFIANGYSIASFPTPRDSNGGLHAVILKDGEFLFDPSPIYREEGVTYEGFPVDWIVFQALDPATLIRRE